VSDSTGEGSLSLLATEALASVSAAESRGAPGVSPGVAGAGGTRAGDAGEGEVGERGPVVVSHVPACALGVVREAAQAARQSTAGADVIGGRADVIWGSADVSRGDADISSSSSSSGGRGGDMSRVESALRALARVSDALPDARVVAVPAVAAEATGLFSKAALVSVT